MEKLTPEIIVEAASVEDEVRRVRYNVASFDRISGETSNIVMPQGLDVQHGSNLTDAERMTRDEYDPSFYKLNSKTHTE
jgi:hypothetical protein